MSRQKSAFDYIHCRMRYSDHEDDDDQQRFGIWSKVRIIGCSHSDGYARHPYENPKTERDFNLAPM